jgi:hypothetical protein
LALVGLLLQIVWVLKEIHRLLLLLFLQQAAVVAVVMSVV